MRYNSYYNKKIRLDELEYITADDISNAHINITSDKMYKEAHDFNDHMIEMQKKREVYVKDLYGTLFFNLIMSVIVYVFTLFMDMDEILMIPNQILPKLSMLYLASGKVWICLLLLFIVEIIFYYLVFFKKNYNPLVGAVILMIGVFVNMLMILPIIVNIFILKIVRDAHDAIKGDAGYPYFVPLNMTYFREDDDDKNTKAMEDYKFDDYIISPDADMGIPTI
ncbi:MAG: hypothetical protein IKJ87_04605 [Ruminococcus sp.]|nr:hypothetical protein [Ruminococcus sp.]